jgi:hypothetical protein
VKLDKDNNGKITKGEPKKKKQDLQSIQARSNTSGRGEGIFFPATYSGSRSVNDKYVFFRQQQDPNIFNLSNLL